MLLTLTVQSEIPLQKLHIPCGSGLAREGGGTSNIYVAD
jgi:hypothetical protein